MVSPGVREATPQKNPQSPREKGAECEVLDSMRGEEARHCHWRGMDSHEAGEKLWVSSIKGL